jgi:tripartite ATP-independent transporter DctP family solute receptor
MWMKQSKFSCGMVLAMILFLAAPGMAAEFKMKITTVVGPPHPWIDASNYFAQKVAERSGGKIEVVLYDRGKLGNDSATLKALRDGTVDLHIGGSANAATYVPELSFFNLGYLFEDQVHFERVLHITSPVFKDTAQIIEGKGLGFKVLSLTGGGLRNISNRLRPIRTIDDLKGIKMRVPGGKTAAQFWKAVGTLPVSLPWTEIYSAMQTGVVDAFESTVPGYYSAKLFEVTKYHSVSEHEFMLSVFFISEKTFKKLSPDLKKIILEAGAEAGDVAMKSGVKQTKDLLEEIKGKGVDVHSVDKSGFIKASLPLQEEEGNNLKLGNLLKEIRALGSGRR